MQRSKDQRVGAAATGRETDFFEGKKYTNGIGTQKQEFQIHNNNMSDNTGKPRRPSSTHREKKKKKKKKKKSKAAQPPARNETRKLAIARVKNSAKSKNSGTTSKCHRHGARQNKRKQSKARQRATNDTTTAKRSAAVGNWQPRTL